ncbi:hypothetical protein OIU78_026481 [Salix suchowensis]|nr:hypothetical protein OIU78_026481 [Salix suchowensis]
MDDEKNGIYCKEISKPGILAHYADHEDNNEIERDDGEGQQDREEAADEQQMLSDVGSFGLKDAVECSRSETNFQCDEKEAYIMERESYGMNSIYQGFDDSMIEYCFGKDNSIEIINLHSERNLGCDFNRLIPVELIDSSTTANYESWSLKEDLAEGIHQNGTTDSASHIEMNNEEQTSSCRS